MDIYMTFYLEFVGEMKRAHTEMTAMRYYYYYYYTEIAC